MSTNIANSGNSQTSGGMAMSGKSMSLIRPKNQLSRLNISMSKNFDSHLGQTEKLAKNETKTKNLLLARQMLNTLYESRIQNEFKTTKNVKLEPKNATNVLLKNNNRLKTKAINILTDLYHKKMKEKERRNERSRRMAQMKNESYFKEISADLFADKNRMSGLKSNLLKSHPKAQHPLFEISNGNNGTISNDDCAEINKNIR